MSSWTQTVENPDYQDALRATEGLESPAQGFIRPSKVQGGPTSLSAVILKQNNTIIQLLVKACEKLEDCNTEIKSLKEKARKAKEEDLEDSIQGLTKKLEQISLGSSSKEPVKKAKGSFFVFEDPLKIYEREKKKAQQ